MRRRHLVRAGLAAGAVLAVPGAPRAQGWPARPIRYIVPFPPGGPTDAVGRMLSQRLGEVLGQPVVVENVGGAGGTLGVERLSKVPADGYAIGLGTTGTHAINPYLYAHLPYDPTGSFTPLSNVMDYVNLLVVHAAHPARDLAGLLAAARAGDVSYGSAGNGSSNHLSGELLRLRAGVPLQHIPFRGSGPAMTEVVAGRVTCMFDTLATALPQVRAGHVRALAVTGPARHPLLPQVPAVAETLPGYAVVGWNGLFGPAGLPSAIASRLNDAIVRSVQEPGMRDWLLAQGLEPAAGTPQALSDRVARDSALWGPVVRSAGLRPE